PGFSIQNPRLLTEAGVLFYAPFSTASSVGLKRPDDFAAFACVLASTDCFCGDFDAQSFLCRRRRLSDGRLIFFGIRS
ncbi:MAG: hypothetical protein ACI4SV_03500, partial [Duodenibacillus sp.]